MILLRVLQSYEREINNKERNTSNINQTFLAKKRMNFINLKQITNENQVTSHPEQKSSLLKLSKNDNLEDQNDTNRRTQLKRFLNDNIINLVQTNNTVKPYKLKYSDQWKRKPRKLDTYAESLLYVNRIYNAAYGFERRRVPAHMPHLLDKWIIHDMQNRFQDEFKITSKHKVRNSEDMQFAFSYFYYLMSEKRKLLAGEIFDKFDTDKSQ